MSTGETSSLKDIFKNANALDIQNKEVSALMGKSDDVASNVLPGGIISKYGRVEAKDIDSKKKKRNQAFISWLFRQSIQKALTKLQAIIDFHLEQMRLFEEQIKQANEQLEILNDGFEELQKELKKYQENGSFDLDENGNLKNKPAEKILSDWEQLTGQKIDLTAENSYGNVLFILMNIEKQKQALENDIQEKQQQYEYHKLKLDEAEKIKEDLQNGNPEQARLALSKINKLQEEKIIFYTDNTPDKDKQTVQNDFPETTNLVSNNTNHDDFLSAFPKLNDEFSQASIGEMKNTEPKINKIQSIKMIFKI